MEFKKGWINARLKKTLYNALKLSFFSWAGIFAWMILSGMREIGHFSAFLAFTAAVMGVNNYFDRKKEGGDQ